MKKIYFYLLITTQILLLASCKDETYSATISIENKTKSIVKDLKIESINYNFDSIESIDSLSSEILDIKWVGRRSGLFGSIDNSYITIDNLTYSIGDSSFDLKNLEGVIIDSYGNYYTDKSFTNNANIEITISNDGYKIQID